MLKKIFITLSLIIFGAVSSVSAAISSPADIMGHKYEKAIEYLYFADIITGYPDHTFKPDKTLNRAELLKILVGGKGVKPEDTYKECFSDIKTEWFAPYVCYAKEQGWVQGYSDLTFRPAQEVNRAEAIKMLIMSQGFKVPSNEELISIDINPFDDVKAEDWFAPYIQVAQSKSFLPAGCNKYKPGESISRGEISENIYRVLISAENGFEDYESYRFSSIQEDLLKLGSEYQELFPEDTSSDNLRLIILNSLDSGSKKLKAAVENKDLSETDFYNAVQRAYKEIDLGLRIASTFGGDIDYDCDNNDTDFKAYKLLNDGRNLLSASLFRGDANLAPSYENFRSNVKIANNKIAPSAEFIVESMKGLGTGTDTSQ